MNNLLRITCLGDVAPVASARDAIMENPQAAREIFAGISMESDVIFANLEAPVTAAESPRENKKYILKTSSEILDIFPRKMVFSIANNHILDYGAAGLMETIDNLSGKKLKFTGAGENLAEAGKPVIAECDGKNVGFIACADSRYLAATENNPGVFPADPALLIPKITKLKTAVDLVYVSVHMGMEYISVPTPGMQRLAGQCHLAGANVVFFHHAHCVSGYILRENGATLWGLGNFIFPENDQYPFKPWFEAASWSITHDISASSLDLHVTSFLINKNGLPEQPEKKTEKKIIERIENISRQINSGKNLSWVRLKCILNISYLKIVFSNYSDIVRRRGFMQVVRQMISSVKIQFLKNDQHDPD